MNLWINTKYRSRMAEKMDDFSISGLELRKTLITLEKINKWLGGNRVTLNGIKKVLNGHPKQEPITILDLGCGGGDILRDVAEYGKQKGYSFKIIGVDANKSTLGYAKELSQSFPDISFLHCDIFSEEFKRIEYDLVLTSLFLHHFDDQQLEKMIKGILEKASIGIVVNDLHRHAMAYFLFRLLCLFTTNDMVREDGLISILKGFKRDELIRISENIGASYRIKWKWAFRYQWIIQSK
jgi:2-polyprenyl-3-methyl-5-hydroxy-6-metoxy-1,4-benzoquinol methylase